VEEEEEDDEEDDEEEEETTCCAYRQPVRSRRTRQTDIALRREISIILDDTISSAGECVFPLRGVLPTPLA